MSPKGTLYVLLGLLIGALALSTAGAAQVSRSPAVDAARADSFQTAQLLRRLLGGERGHRREARQEAGAGVVTRKLEVGGRTRVYYLYVPPSAQNGPAPLVIAFHGGGGSALPFARRIGLREMADRHGFIVAAPEGVGGLVGGQTWNAGGQQDIGYAEQADVDDVGFVAALIDDVESIAAVDPSRIYAMGLSMGGMMAYDAACSLPGRFAAIAAVASTMTAEHCTPPVGVSLLHIHGTADENVPWEGGSGELTRTGSWPPVQRGISLFTQANHCPAFQPAHQVTSDTMCQSASCDSGEMVEICRVQGGGHAWPGTPPAGWQERTNTYVSQSFDATEYIANFFESH